MSEVLEGGDALLERLEGMIKRSSDLAPAFEAVIEDFRSIERKRFSANGPGWPPLAESTISMTGSWARENTNYDQILINTGVMYDSLQESEGGGYTLISPDMVEVGTTVPYAHWHQTGGFRLHASGAGWPPQRKIVDLTDADRVEWAMLVEGWIMGGVVAEVL